MAVTDRGPLPFTVEQRRLAIGLLAMVTIIATETMSVSTVLPVVEKELGDIALYGWIGAGFTLAQLVGVVVGGRWCDRTNPVIPMQVGIALFVAGLSVATLAPTMLVLVLARVLQGLGAGMAPSVAYVCIGRGFGEFQRPRMFALLSTAWIVPSLAAPTVASFVAEHAHWRWVFAGLLPFTLIGAMAVFGPVRSIGPPPESHHGDEATTVLAVVLAAGSGLLLAGLGASVWWLGALAVAGGLVLGVPAFRLLTPPGTLVARPGIAAACAVKGLLTFAFFSADFFVSLAIVDGRGRSTLYAGSVIMVGAFTWTAGSWVQTRLVRTWGYRGPVVLGLALVALGVGVFASVLLESVPLPVAYLGTMVSGFGIGVSYSPLSQVVLVDAEPGRVGKAASAVQLCDVLGVSIGIGAGGAVVAAGDRLGWQTNSALGIVYAGAVAVALFALWPASRLRTH